MMTDEELLSIIGNDEDLTPASIWEKIRSRAPGDWAGDANWQFKFDNELAVDAFLQLAFSDVPAPPPMDYVDSLTSNYRLAIVGAPDAADKVIRAYELCYQRMLDAIVESIYLNVVACAQSPDTDVEVAEVEAEARRFRDSTISPRFLT